MQNKVTAVIPTLGHNPQRLNLCITSLFDSTGVDPFEVIVIQNDPRIKLSLDSRVTVLNPGMNLGNVGGLEYARSTISTQFLWMIQDDMQVDQVCLRQLLARINADPMLALISPIAVKNGLVPAFSRGGTYSDNPESMIFFPPTSCSPDELPNSDSLSFVAGSGALVRMSALEMFGGFNLRLFPVSYGDVDLCMNIRSNGMKFGLENSAHIHHDVNGSSPGILIQTLSKTNARIAREKFQGLDTEISIAGDLDPRIILAIAQKASLLVVDLAEAAQRELNQLENSFPQKVNRFVGKIHLKIIRAFKRT